MDIESLEHEVAELRKKLAEKEAELMQKKQALTQESSPNNNKPKLSKEEIARYSRQIIMPQIRVKGQLALKNASVLIVGAGGLGCPSALYLAGAGVGHIGLVDYDAVETNNLHRQLLHCEASVGRSKVDSAAEALHRLNSGLRVTRFATQLDSSNALSVVRQFDVVLDATDNVATRYLLSDACVLTRRPLVSGSALQWDGQLTVYGHRGGPCYRCTFPRPPPAEAVTNCGDGGVLGVVPGAIGVLQALEAIKIILGLPGVLSERWLIFDGLDCSFRNFKLRGRNPACVACGESPEITRLIDYEQFCGAKANDKAQALRSVACVQDHRLHLLPEAERVSAAEYGEIVRRGAPHLTIDVRKAIEFEICHLPGSVNIPLAELKEPVVERLRRDIEDRRAGGTDVLVLTLCRRGNDSQRAALQLRQLLGPLPAVTVRDIAGGLHAWARDVDPAFPVY